VARFLAYLFLQNEARFLPGLDSFFTYEFHVVRNCYVIVWVCVFALYADYLKVDEAVIYLA